jgi:two-component system NtrC family sensor kinase
MQFRPSLITKLTFATSLILIGFMGLLDYINLKNFRNAMIDYAVANADQVAEIINQSAYDAMMKNDKASLYQMISRIAKSNDIEHIRLIDREGRVAFSSVAEEAGTVVGKNAEMCVMCHKTHNPRVDASSMNRSRLYRTATGKEVLGFTKAIYNQPGCSTGSCHFHRSDYRILGVMDISISLENLQQRSHEYRMQFIVMTCLLLVLIGVLITVLTRRLVNRPVQRLMRHTALVADGNLAARVAATSSDELGELSEAVNRMTENLGKASDELREWAGSLEQKVDERSREIQKMGAQLQRSERLAALGKLVAGIAHEINNPLTGVLLYASILNTDKRLDAALKPDLERIISETRRCADIVKQLLEFSREAVPRKEAFPVETLLDKVIDLFQQLPGFHTITIDKCYDQNLPQVYADPGQIQQVFVNLFINAGHAMPEGGRLTINACRSLDGLFVRTEIVDTGCGIPEENLQRIFDPFFTTKADGTGLGLSISYGIVENNCGRIEVGSVLGEGTAFVISLPVNRESTT